MAMNEQKRKFARHLLLGKSNRDAALAAGYKAKSASSQGSRLASDPEILEYVAKLRAQAERELNGAPDEDDQKRKIYTDSKEYFLDLMNGPDTERADFAAKQLLPIQHAKKAPLGVGDQRAKTAGDLADTPENGDLFSQMESRVS